MIKKKLNNKLLKKNFKKSIAIIVGESTGLLFLKKIIIERNSFFNICYVVNSDKKYDSEVKKICKKNRIIFFSKKDFLKKERIIIKINKKCNFLISVYSSLILSKSFLKSLNYQCYNFHPGILPFYPGKNCVSGAIYNSEKEIGVTIHKMARQVDSGKILMIGKIKINKNENLLSAMRNLRILVIKLLYKFLKAMKYSKKFHFKKNDQKKIRFYPKYIPNSGLIDKNLTFDELYKRYKASDTGPFPNSWGRLFFRFNKKKFFIKEIKKKFLPKKNNSLVKKINNETFLIKIKNVDILVKAQNDKRYR